MAGASDQFADGDAVRAVAGGSTPEDGRTPASRARIPAPASVYVGWGATLLVAFGGIVSGLSLSGEEASWFWPLAGTLILLVGGSFLLAFAFERRRRFIARCRSEALDLCYAI